ncbi:hypothetical protein FACS189479_03430 [Spirochaetia bacterium]|nr:hypothetical protein FACS189479_03430 [Spirochaetia bacterium]
MTVEELSETVSLGETSTVQFKEAEVRSAFDNQDKIPPSLLIWLTQR